VQEAFVKAFRALRSFRRTESFKPWLLRIVANETRNLHRSGKRREDRVLRAATLLPATEPVDPESAAVASHERSALLDAVRALPERDRLVLTCRYLLDLSEEETARVLGWPRGTVKSRLSRALGKLRPMVTADGEREEALDD